MINTSVHVFPCSASWEGLEENDTPVAVSTASAQILVSNTIRNSHKRNQSSGEMADSRTGTGNKCTNAEKLGSTPKKQCI